jgi:glyoxylase-like metal-dependent hydrolase (beta-lactamase superfamily II)
MEIVPGIHRIESDLGPRFMCQYLLVGDERTVLIDTGLAGTPGDVLAPYAEGIGMSLEDIDDVVISHADVDHCGGNAALRRVNRRVRLSCHELDRRWIESNAAMLNENYRWYEAYGFGPGDEALAWISEQLGGDCPIDVGLRGGETFRLASDRRLEILHLAGHTPGHLGVWDPTNDTLIIIDAVLQDGIYDRQGNRLIPPRYYDAAAYESTIRRIRSLSPGMLLTAHYPAMTGAGALEWLDDSLQFVNEMQRVVGDGLKKGVTDLWELTRLANERVGPYPEFMTELGASVRAHAAVPGQMPQDGDENR